MLQSQVELLPGAAMGTWRNVFIQMWRRPGSLNESRRARVHFDRLKAAYGARVATLVVVESDAIASLPPDVRAEAEAQSRDYESLGVAIAIEDSGFKAAAMRTIIAGIHLVTRMRSPRRVFSSGAAAADWLVREILAGSEHDASELRAMLERMRAEIR